MEVGRLEVAKAKTEETLKGASRGNGE